ncbi:7-cyano-7-deazaguanine synthase QueC [Dehalobacterium formicoaceticum]|uniref:7-cyano-7-deazaguanine synthase n=1 Tax=Dehalobacterium formicoaceticum TaxID=51515 RepID=A0ABT1Y2G7_9FIRM|nr:7-cyano-7-deazaguanine synthase QueC [Dehalobacterium formicoaceticum]MCR6544748.1 7-cyano-7-deazaguanine synthase QueC [Dehalobacterium formicoaceticum]
MKAVVLLSGGLDSTVCMSIAQQSGVDIIPISFDYGQRHHRELACAKQVADFYQVKKHVVIETNMRAIGGSALTADIEVPQGQEEREHVPVTYVPARNLIFLSYALGLAEVENAVKIYIGVNAVDYSGYPDCRAEFIEKFQSITDYATKASVENHRIIIENPLQYLTKGEIVALGIKNGAPLHLTTSCYQGGALACGVCDSCVLRLKGFREAGFTDPIPYQDQ